MTGCQSQSPSPSPPSPSASYAVSATATTDVVATVQNAGSHQQIIHRQALLITAMQLIQKISSVASMADQPFLSIGKGHHISDTPSTIPGRETLTRQQPEKTITPCTVPSAASTCHTNLPRNVSHHLFTRRSRNSLSSQINARQSPARPGNTDSPCNHTQSKREFNISVASFMVVFTRAMVCNFLEIVNRKQVTHFPQFRLSCAGVLVYNAPRYVTGRYCRTSECGQIHAFQRGDPLPQG